MNLSPNQDRPNVNIPPPLIFFALLLIGGLLEYWFEVDIPKDPTRFSKIISLLLFAFSGYLALHAMFVLKKSGTFVDPGKPTIRIVNEGPFRFSRNPMYLSLVLVMFASAIWFFSIWLLFSTAVLWYLLHRNAVVPEEVYLHRKFGESYEQYKSKVRRWI